MTPSAPDSDEGVALTLSRDAALVLFDLLTRFSHEQQLQIQHQAEERVLWDIHCDLESALPEPLAPHYEERLQQARQRVCDHE
jgi:hypothetical protein